MTRLATAVSATIVPVSVVPATIVPTTIVPTTVVSMTVVSMTIVPASTVVALPRVFAGVPIPTIAAALPPAISIWLEAAVVVVVAPRWVATGRRTRAVRIEG